MDRRATACPMVQSAQPHTGPAAWLQLDCSPRLALPRGRASRLAISPDCSQQPQASPSWPSYQALPQCWTSRPAIFTGLHPAAMRFTWLAILPGDHTVPGIAACDIAKLAAKDMRFAGPGITAPSFTGLAAAACDFTTLAAAATGFTGPGINVRSAVSADGCTGPVLPTRSNISRDIHQRAQPNHNLHRAPQNRQVDCPGIRGPALERARPSHARAGSRSSAPELATRSPGPQTQ